MTDSILRTLNYAWKQCVKYADCGGVTQVKLNEHGHTYYRYELRSGRTPTKETDAYYSYFKKSCS